MALKAAYRKDTGEKVHIPEHWFNHPTLGKPFSKTPRQRNADGPDDSWTVTQLRTHADRNGIDLAGATTKAEILTAIATPATGDTSTQEK